MQKAFYPRNDTVNATVSNLLPRDGKEDILHDQSGDPVFLQRSSVLDGTVIKGFGYVNSKPYKWYLEIESAVKSVAVVPDRFFSIYGKSYPIKRRQTVGINQPSELFKYEIIYMRGWDEYDDEPPVAKIIYHAQAEGKPVDNSCSVPDSDSEALKLLDDFKNYPYLKLRVCLDGSIRAYLGSTDVDWDLTRPVDGEHGDPDDAWVEIPQINTEQFRNIDLWVRFDSINALAYYLITKYENNIFDIGPKEIEGGLETARPVSAEYYYARVIAGPEETIYQAGIESIEENDNLEIGTWYSRADFIALADSGITSFSMALEQISLRSVTIDPTGVLELTDIEYRIDANNEVYMRIPYIESAANFGAVSDVVGLDYSLKDSAAVADGNCVPCCKKDNLSRSIWAYVNPNTMLPYEDDYWFHQGESFFKKSLTLSTKQNPLDAKKIFIEQGTFPGMYKIVCETKIRNRDGSGDDMVQITLPLCKITSDQTLTLQADGDPTTFNLGVEVATPKNGIPMEMTFFKVEKEMKPGCGGSMIEKDGSTKISAV